MRSKRIYIHKSWTMFCFYFTDCLFIRHIIYPRLHDFVNRWKNWMYSCTKTKYKCKLPSSRKRISKDAACKKSLSIYACISCPGLDHEKDKTGLECVYRPNLKYRFWIWLTWSWHPYLISTGIIQSTDWTIHASIKYMHCSDSTGR